MEEELGVSLTPDWEAETLCLCSTQGSVEPARRATCSDVQTMEDHPGLRPHVPVEGTLASPKQLPLAQGV